MTLPAADTDPRFHRLGLKLGLFVGAGLLLCVALLLAMAVRQGYFSPKTPVRFLAESGTDLRPGMAVKLSGFKIGEVRSVELNQQARVDVEMQIENRYLQWIKGNSVVTLAREGMIGDSFLSISSGNPELPALVPDDRLRFVAGSSLGDIATDVRNRVVPVIEELHTFLRYTNDPKGDIRASFRELHALTRDLQQTNRQAATTLASLDRLARDDTPATLAQARSALARAEASLAELEKAVPALSAQATRSLAALDQATAAAAGSAARASALMDATRPRLDGTLAEAEQLMRDSRSAINAARTRWPFKGPDVPPAVVAPLLTAPAPADPAPVAGQAPVVDPAPAASAR